MLAICELCRRMWGAEMEGWQQGWKDKGMVRGMEDQKDRRMEGSEDGEEDRWMLPQPPTQSISWGTI